MVNTITYKKMVIQRIQCNILRKNDFKNNYTISNLHKIDLMENSKELFSHTKKGFTMDSMQ